MFTGIYFPSERGSHRLEAASGSDISWISHRSCVSERQYLLRRKWRYSALSRPRACRKCRKQGGTADILLRPFSGTEFFVCQFCYYNMNCENCFCNGAICGYQVRVRFYVTVHSVLSNDFSSLTLWHKGEREHGYERKTSGTGWKLQKQERGIQVPRQV